MGRFKEICKRHDASFTDGAVRHIAAKVSLSKAHQDRGWLIKRIEKLEDWNQGLNTVNEKLLDRAKRAEAELDKVREWIQEYGMHPRSCPKAMFPTNEKEIYKCTCGLQAILEKE